MNKQEKIIVPFIAWHLIRKALIETSKPDSKFENEFYGKMDIILTREEKGILKTFLDSVDYDENEAVKNWIGKE